MTRLRRFALALLALTGGAISPAAAQQNPAPDIATLRPSFEPMEMLFPSFEGWAEDATGGFGGEIVRVTNLAADGPGSLRAAIALNGPRIVVFEVGGVIDLQGETLEIASPNITIAGQTAPAPGVTLAQGGLRVRANNVIIQHMRVRPGAGEAERFSGWEVDAVSVDGAQDVVIDHCSLYWSTDEGLSAGGDAPPARRVTFSNNIIAEGLSNASHRFGEHSKGTLVHDGVTDILILRNLYAHNYERNPLFKGGTRGAVVNNLIFNPGLRALHYNHFPRRPGERVPNGALSAVGNVVRAGPSTDDDLAFLTVGGFGDLDYFAYDNIALDEGGGPLPGLGRYTSSGAKATAADSPPAWPDGLGVLPATAVEAVVLSGVGARPWDRDHHDERLIRTVGAGHGHIIDHEREVGGRRAGDTAQRPFDADQWDLESMRPISLSVLFAP